MTFFIVLIVCFIWLAGVAYAFGTLHRLDSNTSHCLECDATRERYAQYLTNVIRNLLFLPIRRTGQQAYDEAMRLQ